MTRSNELCHVIGPMLVAFRQLPVQTEASSIRILQTALVPINH